MCTVTFVPKSPNGFILISNRDEAPARKTLRPLIYTVNGVQLVYPKDEVAGGTWFGSSSEKRLICLLNGGFKAHKREKSYRVSRGSIVIDLLVAKDIVSEINTYNFIGVEPFTIILVDWSGDLVLYEVVWDGSIVHFAEKPVAPQIWSSSLLYSEETKNKRVSWFSDFISKNSNPSEAALLAFHKTAGEGSKESDLLIDRGFVKTKSITIFSKSKRTTFRYEDLQSSEVYQIEISDH